MWIEIPEETYRTLFLILKERLTVFGACTNLANTSICDAKIVTEWGFEGSGNPLVRSYGEPESQMFIPKDTSEWNWRFYIYRPEAVG